VASLPASKIRLVKAGLLRKSGEKGGEIHAKDECRDGSAERCRLGSFFRLSPLDGRKTGRSQQQDQLARERSAEQVMTIGEGLGPWELRIG